MMILVQCPHTPTGDIRTRQPKSPGQRAATHNAPPRVIVGPPQAVWANSLKRVKDMPTRYRCTHCGHTDHPTAEGRR